MPPIRLFRLQDGSALVWSADEVDRLRRKYRIVGGLISTLASYPQQNSYLGLPLCIDRDQVETLLVLQNKFQGDHDEEMTLEVHEQGDITQVDVSNALLKQEYTTIFRNMFRTQLERNQRSLDKKRQFVEKNIHRQDAKKDEPSAVAVRLQDIAADVETHLQQAFDAYWPHVQSALDSEDAAETQRTALILSLMQDHIADYMQTPCRSHWVVPVESQFVSSQSVPSTCDDRNDLRLRIVRRLQQYQDKIEMHPVQFYLTSGLKFGGDFCLYVGDPVRFHAAAIVHVVPFGDDAEDEQRLTMQDVISWGRVSNVTRKTSMLVSWRPSGDVDEDMSVVSLEWTGW